MTQNSCKFIEIIDSYTSGKYDKYNVWKFLKTKSYATRSQESPQGITILKTLIFSYINVSEHFAKFSQGAFFDEKSALVILLVIFRDLVFGQYEAEQ